MPWPRRQRLSRRGRRSLPSTRRAISVLCARGPTNSAHYPDAWWKTFKEGWITVKPPRRSPYRAQMRAFVDSIVEGRPAAVTGGDGLKAQELIQGAYLAMATGGWVALPLAADAPFLVPSY